MNDRSRRRERYLRDPLPVRLGGLAANLARIRSFSDHPAHAQVVLRLIDESAWFIEWTSVDAPLEIQERLLACQRQLVLWRRKWSQIWQDQTRRAAVAETAGAWAQQLVGMSGLLGGAGQDAGSGGR